MRSLAVVVLATCCNGLLAQQIHQLPPHFETAGGRFVARGLAARAQLFPGGVRLHGPSGEVDLRVVGTLPSSLLGTSPTGAVSNYYFGTETAGHRQGVPHFRGVENMQVLPGVDLEWLVAGVDLRFDLHLAPGVDAASVRWYGSSWRDLTIDAQGNLRAQAAGDELVLSAPRAFQGEGEDPRELPCRFVLADAATVTFEVDDHDPTQPLHIDPVVKWSTWIGGTGTESVEAVDVHPSGHIAVMGTSQSLDLPLLHGTGHPPGSTANPLAGFVLGFAPGGQLLFSTYFGGTDGQTMVFDGGLDFSGNVLLGGSTSSSTLPVAPWVLQPQPGQNWFAQLNWGSPWNATPGTLGWCTYFGGGNGLSAMHVARQQSVIYAGFQWGSVFLPSAYSASQLESYVISIGGGNQLGVATSTGFQAQIAAIHGDLNSNIIVAGLAFAGLPTTPASYQPQPNGFMTPYVFEFTGSANGFVNCTYFGDASCSIEDIDVLPPDPQAVAGTLVITGGTSSFSQSLPLVNAISSTPAPTYVARFNPFTTGLDYCTYIPHTGTAAYPRLGRDAQRRTYVAAKCTSGPWDLPLVNAQRGSYFFNPNNDALLVRLSPAGTSIDYSTYAGGVPTGCSSVHLGVGDDGTAVLATSIPGNRWLPFGGAPPTGGNGFFLDACVQVFAPDVLPSYGTPAPQFGPRPYLSGGGQAVPGGTMTFQVFHAPGGGFGLMAFGDAPVQVPLWGGTLWINLPFATLPLFFGGPTNNPSWPFASGFTSFDLAVPPNPGLSGLPLFGQVAVLDPTFPPAGIVLTNAIDASIQ